MRPMPKPSAETESTLKKLNASTNITNKLKRSSRRSTNKVARITADETPRLLLKAKALRISPALNGSILFNFYGTLRWNNFTRI